MGVKVRERNGAWWVFVDYKGRRKAKRVGSGQEGRKAARTAAEKIQAKLALGDTTVLDERRERALTVAIFVEDWLKHHVTLQRKPATTERYEMVLRKHWLPALGRLPLTGVTRDQIKEVLTEKLGAGLKPRTVKGHLDVLRACLTAAVEDSLTPVNPAARLGKFLPRTGEGQEIDIFTRAELTALLEVAEQHMPDAYPIVLTLARTGLRIGEPSPCRPMTST
jgi:integrase